MTDQLGRYYAGDNERPAGRYYDAVEAAKYLEVSRTWFYVAIKDELKPYTLPSFKWAFYHEADLNRLKTLRQEPEEPE